jgi:hypothetical protein
VLSQALMESEVAGLIGADRHERTRERTGHRNGNRMRTWDTRVGTACRSRRYRGSAAQARRQDLRPWRAGTSRSGSFPSNSLAVLGRWRGRRALRHAVRSSRTGRARTSPVRQCTGTGVRELDDRTG